MLQKSAARREVAKILMVTIYTLNAAPFEYVMQALVLEQPMLLTCLFQKQVLFEPISVVPLSEWW